MQDVFEDVYGRSHDGLQLEYRNGARGGMIAPDQKTFDFLEGRLYAERKLGPKQLHIGKH
jgi:3-isopropylmalate/(R)-2-methylmalate dehydratase large subunit